MLLCYIAHLGGNIYTQIVFFAVFIYVLLMFDCFTLLYKYCILSKNAIAKKQQYKKGLTGIEFFFYFMHSN